MTLTACSKWARASSVRPRRSSRLPFRATRWRSTAQRFVSRTVAFYVLVFPRDNRYYSGSKQQPTQGMAHAPKLSVEVRQVQRWSFDAGGEPQDQEFRIRVRSSELPMRNSGGPIRS